MKMSSILAALPVSLSSLKGASEYLCDKPYFSSDEKINIGSRRQLFVDDYLIHHIGEELKLHLHHPIPHEVVMTYDKQWEGSYCNNHSIFKDEDLYRMYYAGVNYIVEPGKVIDDSHPFFLCYAESKDGIHWSRPDLGLIKFNGSKKNNILMSTDKLVKGIRIDASSFAMFKDDNPYTTLDAKYKAIIRAYTPVGEGPQGILAFKSSDAIHWEPMNHKAIITDGAFDSQNLAFWDSRGNEYRAYWRSKTKEHVRQIRTARSEDFINWTDHADLRYVDSPLEELYTNVVKTYDRAPDYIIGFPVRYIERQWSPSMYALPELKERRMRSSAVDRFGTALTESLFMSSRDGILFKRWNEAFLRPGIQRPGIWNYGQQFLAWQMVETESALEGAPDEISFYATESCWTNNADALRRYTMRLDGFVSVNASAKGGEMVTKPLTFQGNFEGNTLNLNFSTSAAGSILVEIQDENKNPIPGYSLDECYEIFGDEIERVVMWKNHVKFSQLADRAIRLRFFLKDADIFSFRII